MRCAHAIVSNLGNIRERNEDLAHGVPEQGLFLLADGMGGHPAGELASKVAITTALAFLTEPRVPGRSRSRVEKLGQSILAANHEILRLGQEHPEVSGMGTTMVCLWVGGKESHVAHIGDSRAYVMRNGEVTGITRDHTVLRELVDRGEVQLGSPEAQGLGHILTQAVGLEAEIYPDLTTLDAKQGDVYLLCSDGLSDLVPPEEIADCLAGVTAASLADYAQRLIDAALEAGGHDNITVVLATAS